MVAELNEKMEAAKTGVSVKVGPLKAVQLE
jgi:hypothetical protein